MEPNIQMIAPEAVLADSNVRFGLLESRVAKMKDDIVRDGQVNEALEIEPIDPENGCSYRVTVGHYRHAAALALNKEQNAGLMLPCIVKAGRDAQSRLTRQVSENMDRQNLTSMDSAVAIKAMMDAGIPRLDIRKAFSRPNVKGKLEPCSNAYLNMMVSFLDLPKKIQNQIHLGLLPVYQAYMLTKAPKDKQESILADAQAARVKEFEKEDDLEKKFLAEEKKVSEAKVKQEEAEAAAIKLRQEADEAAKLIDEKRQATIEAYAAAKKAKDADEKKKAEEALKAAEKAAQEAEKVLADTTKAAVKAEEKVKVAKETADQRAKRLKKERADADKAKAARNTPTRENIEAATKKATGSGIVALNAKQIKEVVDQISKPNGNAPKVHAIGLALYSCFYGGEDGAQLTANQLFTELKKITGEHKDKDKKAAA